MRRLLLIGVLAGILLAQTGAHAAGCTVTPLTPTCTYTAAGGEIARGGASSTLESGWEAWVTRVINGVPTKVVLAGEDSFLDADPMGHPVPAIAGELVTLELRVGLQGIYGGVVNIS